MLFRISFLALLFSLIPFLSSASAQTEEKKELVAVSLHPVLGDLARRIGGEYVQVVDWLKPNGNLHAFEPSTNDIIEAGKASLVFASGKKIEPYLPKLADALPKSTEIIDLGKDIPDVMISPENAEAVCCEDHDHDHDHDAHEHEHEASPIDPHWWHSMENIKRAALEIEKTFVRKDPAHAKEFAKNRDLIIRECDRLRAWGKRQIMTIPQNGRILVTGHAAFGHLCKEIGFRQIAVQGAAREDEGAAKKLAETLKMLREIKPQAIFPEYQSSPKVLDEIAKSLGIKTAKPLVSDGTAPMAHSFDTMYEYNIKTIVEALAPPQS